MNQKNKITEFLLDSYKLEKTKENIKKYKILWWKNIREKNKGGLWLTSQGFDALIKANIKNYKIKFENPILEFENKFIIWLDNYIDCPFYITKKDIYVFEEKTAIQIILFSGNLKLLYNSHTKYQNKILDKTL
jgi:hypothetical protein